MNDIASFLFASLTGGFIGYITNWLAIAAIFHPEKPFKFLGVEFQGLLPKRRRELAANLGKVVEGELINVKELVDKITPEDINPLVDEFSKNSRITLEFKIKGYVANVSEKIPFFNLSANTLIESTMDKLEKEVSQELKRQLPEVLSKAGEKLVDKISVESIVEEKVNAMRLEKLEEILNKVADKEMKMIVWLGGVFGVAISAVQWIINRFVF